MTTVPVLGGFPPLWDTLDRRGAWKVLQAAEKKALGRRESPQRRGVRQEWRWRRRRRRRQRHRGVSHLARPTSFSCRNFVKLERSAQIVIGLWTKLVSSPARSLTDDGGGLGAGWDTRIIGRLY